MPSGPERVQQALDEKGLYDSRVIRLPESTRTAPEAAKAVGCEVGAIAKSLLFLADGEPLLVICGGDRRVDTERLAKLVAASEVSMASSTEVRSITGYAIGGVPPLGHPAPIKTFMDNGLLSWPMVYAAAGAQDALFNVHPLRLADATGAIMVEVGTVTQ